MDEFTYKYFIENRYSTPSKIVKNIKYSAICNNGFTKLYTDNCRAYWIIQNEFSHKIPDWKFHISVINEDVSKAWDIVSSIFMNLGCRSGMKVAYLKENTNTARGRELTVYIYKYHEKFKESYINEDHNLNLSDEHSEEFWINFYEIVENELRKNNIRSNKCAKGDLQLGEYISLRNEAFVYSKSLGLDIYPLDQHGWNALKHKPPFNIDMFIKSKSKKIYVLIAILVLLCSIIIYK